MTLSELLHKRRSCRQFEPREVGKEVTDALLKDALTAPSSKNTRSTHFAVVGDRDLIDRLSAMRSSGSAFVKDAPAVIVMMGDMGATDLWRENCSISATILQLAAEDRGLGSCWIHVHGRPRNNDAPGGSRAEDYVRDLLGIPANLGILCLIAIGYPAVPPHPRREQDDSDKIRYL